MTEVAVELTGEAGDVHPDPPPGLLPDPPPELLLATESYEEPDDPEPGKLNESSLHPVK